MSATSPLQSACRIDATTVIAVAVTVVAWASAFPAIRAGLAAFGPAELGALRFAIAAVPAAIFLAVTRPALPQGRRSLALRLRRHRLRRALHDAAQFRRADRFGRCRRASSSTSARSSPPCMAMALLGERFSGLAWLGTVDLFRRHRHDRARRRARACISTRRAADPRLRPLHGRQQPSSRSRSLPATSR